MSNPQAMKLSDLSALIAASPDPVLLLEGRRSISPVDFRVARGTARALALGFPRLRFRSGNAEGSDQAFSDGIASVDPARLHVVAPYDGHRKRYRTPDVTYDSPDSLNRAREESLAYHTIEASPHNKRLIDRRATGGALAAKARYLLRDTMKVVGHPEAFPPPVAALFHIDPDDPEAGGTGHTIRVCKQHGIPFAFQDKWRGWFDF